jgi:tRNA pseudouridine55 synthase
MSRRKLGRDVHGILLLDKPPGMTSNAALQQLKKYYLANKAGHTGSLDPLATGMLPICFGQATKFSQFLLEANKQYQVTAKLGIKTDSGDAKGVIISESPVPSLSGSILNRIFKEFYGEITQIPSMYSALKHEGKPLYYYARQGIEVPRKTRIVSIHKLDLVHCQDDCFTVEVACTKGTYVRTLIDDIGDKIGCGAHVVSLRRTQVGHYSAHQMVTLEEIAQQSTDFAIIDSHLLPVDSSLQGYDEIQLADALYYYLRQGQPVMVPHAPTEGWVKLTSSNGKFLGVGEILSDGRVAPRRLIYG